MFLFTIVTCVATPSIQAAVHTGDVVAALELQLLFESPTPSLTIFDTSLGQQASFGNGWAVAADQSTIYAVTSQGLTWFDPSLQTTRRVPLPAYLSNIRADHAGNVYGLGTHAVYEWDSSGTLIRQIALSDAFAIFMDLAPDDCTLWYSDISNHARRYDVCTNQTLPALPTTRQFSFVRALSGGGLLGGDGSNLYAYDSGGILLRTIHLGGVSRMRDVGFSPDRQYIYVGGFGPSQNLLLSKIRVSDGTIVASIAVGNMNPASIAVVGGNPPTAEELGPAAVPVLSPWLFAALTMALALTALRRVG